MGKYKRKDLLPAVCFEVPPPARPASETEFEALKLKGFDGSSYDMLACYQLGQLFFDGIAAPKNAATTSTASADASADAATAADAPSFESAAAPWSLPKNHSQSLLWFTNAAFEGHGERRTLVATSLITRAPPA